MYLTSGAKVSTRRSRRARSFARRYSRHSASESSEDILRAARRGAVASVMLSPIHKQRDRTEGVSALLAGSFRHWTLRPGRLPKSGYPARPLRIARALPMTAGMALRLIDSPEPARPQAPSAPAIGRLLPAATARLTAGDWAGYRAVVAQTAEVEDVHRRYEARRALLAAGLRAASTPAALVATAATALDVLLEDAREPILLNAAGVAFY